MAMPSPRKPYLLCVALLESHAALALNVTAFATPHWVSAFYAIAGIQLSFTAGLFKSSVEGHVFETKKILDTLGRGDLYEKVFKTIILEAIAIFFTFVATFMVYFVVKTRKFYVFVTTAIIMLIGGIFNVAALVYAYVSLINVIPKNIQAPKPGYSVFLAIVSGFLAFVSVVTLVIAYAKREIKKRAQKDYVPME